MDVNVICTCGHRLVHHGAAGCGASGPKRCGCVRDQNAVLVVASLEQIRRETSVLRHTERRVADTTVRRGLRVIRRDPAA